MRRIEPHNLWIGHRGDLRDPRLVSSHDVSLVIDLAIDEPPLVLAREVAVARFPLDDGAGNAAWLVRGAISLGVRVLSEGETVLVACSSGLSRSPAIAAAMVAVREGVPPEQALRRVTAAEGDVSPGLWGAVASAIADVADSV